MGEKLNREEAARAVGAIVEDLGYECVHVVWTAEGACPVIRIYIDSVGGINITDCEVVSKAVNRWLDSEDPLDSAGRYYLEVSSPGLERPLFTPMDYRRFQGREARVKTLEALSGRKLHTGIIVAADETAVTLKTEENDVLSIPFGLVTRASLVFRGLEAQEPKKLKKKDGKSGKHKEEQ